MTVTVSDGNGGSASIALTIEVTKADAILKPPNELSDGDIRLVGGDDALEGRVEIYHNEVLYPT